MIGKLEHTPTSSDEDKYRCFVVGKSMGGSFEMAQSGDATCNGMSSPTDGSRTMKFTRGKLDQVHIIGIMCAIYKVVDSKFTSRPVIIR